jgi:hypothetical protein
VCYIYFVHFSTIYKGKTSKAASVLKQQTMKTYEEVEAKLHEFLTSGFKVDTATFLQFFPFDNHLTLLCTDSIV